MTESTVDVVAVAVREAHTDQGRVSVHLVPNCVVEIPSVIVYPVLGDFWYLRLSLISDRSSFLFCFYFAPVLSDMDITQYIFWT